MKRVPRYLGLALLWLLLVCYFGYLRFPFVRLRALIEPRIAALGLGKVSFDEMHATAFGGVKMRGVSFTPAGLSAGKPIQIDELSLKPAVWRFVRGGRGMRFDAGIGGGRAQGTAGITKDAHTQIAVSLDDIDLARAALPGLPEGTEGTLSGKVNLDFEHVAVDGARGSVHLEAAHGSLPPISTAGMKVVPNAVRYDSAVLDAALDGPKIEIGALKLAGPDVEGSATGTLTARGRSLATSEMNTDVRFRIPEGSTLKSLEGLIAGFHVKKDAEGYFTLKLGGTLNNPRPKL